jgi:hypothetical protein
MIEIQKYQPAEVIPRGELLAWRARIRETQPKINCPDEVRQFIDAIAGKMADFGQMRVYNDVITGYELMLANIKEVDGAPVMAWKTYPLQVPHMIAVDHYTWMHRIFRRKGKKGLIDYCRGHVKKTALEATLRILNEEVFHAERPEFKRVMDEIQQSKKIEIQFEQ